MVAGGVGISSNLYVEGSLVATNIGAFKSTGNINFDNKSMTNVNIDSGAINTTDISIENGYT